MADSKQTNKSMSTLAAFLLVVFFMSSLQVNAELLVDPTLIGQALQAIATNALGVDEMQVRTILAKVHFRQTKDRGNSILDLIDSVWAVI